MEIERARQKENIIKAVAFHSRKCQEEYFAKWRTYSKLMVAKRQLRDLHAQKEKSKAKVQSFLKNIDSFEQERNIESRLQAHRKQNPIIEKTPTKAIGTNNGTYKYCFAIHMN